jgi:hypothetical protein
VNSNTHKTVQDQERETNSHFSVDDAVLLVDSERDARAARKHLGMKAIVFEFFWEWIETWDNVPLLVVSTCHACCLAEIVIERHGPGINVRFVDLEGESLESMAKKESSRSRLYRLLENPWHMTTTLGRC